MMSSELSWSTIGKCLVLLAVAVLGYHTGRKVTRAVKWRTTNINEVIFFHYKLIKDKSHVHKIKKCKKIGCTNTNIKRVLDYLNRCKVSLDVCQYFMSCTELSEAVLKAHLRGVKVRVIADHIMSDGTSSQIGLLQFRRHGIPVMNARTRDLMHHRFVVLDREILMIGSFNWTMQTITGTWDNLLVTSEPGLVEPLAGHFDILWYDLNRLLN